MNDGSANRIATDRNGPQSPVDLWMLLDDAFAQFADREAVVGRNDRLSFAELAVEVDVAAEALRSHGVTRGDRVAACLSNHPALVTAFLATLRLGAVWLGVNRALALPEKLHILADSGTSLLIAEPAEADLIKSHRSNLPTMRHILRFDTSRGEGEWPWRTGGATAFRMTEAVDAFAPALLSYTSGTTGRPKAVVHSQYNVALAVASRLTRPWSVTERHGVCTPMTIANLMIVGPLASLASGGTTICVDSTFAPAIASWVEREKIQSLSAASAIFNDLLTRPDIPAGSVDTLRSISMGSAHVPDDFRKIFADRFGDRVVYAYGLTEAPTVVASTTPGEPFPSGAVGRPLPHIELAILDEQGARCPVAVQGEICIRAAQSGPWAGLYRPMLGYWNNLQATADALWGGWLHTGDLGRLDSEGFLFVTGRLKEMISRGGSNVYPAEIERVLQDDQDVLYCAVAGKPDLRLGETVAAFIQVASTEVDREALITRLEAACKASLARYKVPSDWVIVDDMPRNAMKKIMKHTLIERHFLQPSSDAEASGKQVK